MPKHIAIWVLSIKIVEIWSLLLPVMRGSLLFVAQTFVYERSLRVYGIWLIIYSLLAAHGDSLPFYFRCLAVSPNFEIAKNNMAIALTDLGTKVITGFIIKPNFKLNYVVSSYDQPNLIPSPE